MKNIKYSLIILVLLATVSCQKYLDTNSDPNSAKNTRVDLVLASAQLNLAFGMGSRTYEILNVWNQYWTSDNTVASGDWEANTMSPNDAAQLWNTLYRTSLSSLRYIIQSGNQPKYSGVAKILMAYEYQVLVDLYGDIPFSEALLGAEATPNRAPKVDKQTDIYPQLYTMASDGARLLDSTGSGIDEVAGDLIFDGDLNKWHAFANALRLRILMRQAKIDPSGIQPKVVALVDEVNNAGQSFDVDAEIQFSGDPAETKNKNPLFTNLETALHNHYNGSLTSFDILDVTNTSDPRLGYFYEDLSDGGRPHGDQIIVGTFSRPKGKNDADAGTGGDPKLYGANFPFILIGPWESPFFLAEAAVYGWVPLDPHALYDQAVRSNFDYFGAGDPSTYLSTGSMSDLTGGQYDATSTQTQLRSIAIQKWICMNGIEPLESFNEVRRADEPGNIIFRGPGGIFADPPKNALGAGQFPSIFYYSQTETSLNPNIIQHNNVTDKVFWDN